MRHALASLCLLAALTAVRTAAADIAPLSDKQKSVMFGSAEDSLDKKDCMPKGEHKRGSNLNCKDSMHYVHANEWMHQVWKPYLLGIGGAHVGVGTDQNFTLIAWAHSEIGFLMDYDPHVVRVNYAHLAFVKNSPDVATFLSRYSPKGKADAVKILETEYASHPERDLIIAAYNTYRGTLASYFKDVMSRRSFHNHFLHDDADYQYVHQLAAAGRIRVMKGDLLKDKSMRGIAQITQALGIPMRMVYMSNAEEFWPYPKNFRENYANMNMDDKTVVLRCRHTDIYGPRVDGYVYIVEDGVDFRTKIQMKTDKDGWKYNGIWTLMVGRKPAPERKGLFTIGPVELVAPGAISKR